jgi:hypothetical protein
MCVSSVCISQSHDLDIYLSIYRLLKHIKWIFTLHQPIRTSCILGRKRVPWITELCRIRILPGRQRIIRMNPRKGCGSSRIGIVVPRDQHRFFRMFIRNSYPVVVAVSGYGAVARDVFHGSFVHKRGKGVRIIRICCARIRTIWLAGFFRRHENTVGHEGRSGRFIIMAGVYDNDSDVSWSLVLS